VTPKRFPRYVGAAMVPHGVLRLLQMWALRHAKPIDFWKPCESALHACGFGFVNSLRTHAPRLIRVEVPTHGHLMPREAISCLM
jgi:hypothetical protein